MNKPKTHSKWARAALVVPSAALMLGASEAQTSVGLNFQTWFQDNYGQPATAGPGSGLMTTGMQVTATAFGIGASDWTNADPMISKPGIISTPQINAGPFTFGGATNPLSATVTAKRTDLSGYTAEGVWGAAAGSTWGYWTAGTPAASVVVSSITSGDYQAAWGYLTGEGWDVAITGLNAKFPSGYAIGIIGEAGVETGSLVTIKENAGSTQVGTVTGFALLPDGLGVGASSGTLTNDAITLSNSATAAEATGLAGIIITDKPVIMRGPAPFKGLPGSNFTLTAPSVGTGTLTYQWRKGGIAIPAATSPTLTITGATASDSGSYDVVVDNASGSATSSAAAVVIATPGAVTWDSDNATGGVQDGSGNWTSVAGTPRWWNGTATVDWNNNNLDVATFGAGGSGPYTVTMLDNIDVNGLTFASGPTYTIAGSTKTLTLVGSATTINAAADATIGAMLAGTGALTKSGAGNLTLTSGANPFSGVINVTAGTLTLSASGTLSTTIHASEYNLSPGTTLAMGSDALGYYGNENATGVTINVNGATSGSSTGSGIRYLLTGGTVTIPGGGYMQIGTANGFSSYIHSKASATPSVVGTVGNSQIRLGNNTTLAGTFTFDTELGTTTSGIDMDIRADLTGPGTTSINPIVKTGAGTLMLSGNIDFTGGITVEGGKLIVAGANNKPQSANGNIQLKDGTALTVTATGASPALATQGTFSVGTDNTNPAGAQTIGFKGISSTTVAPIRGGTVNLDNPVIIKIESPIYDPGDYPLIIGDSSTPASSVSLATLPVGMAATLVNDLGGTTNSLVLHVTTAAPVSPLAWDGNAGVSGSQDGSGTWSQSTASWWDGSADVNWNNAANNTAVFGSGTAGTYTVTLAENVSAAGLTVTNGNYTIAPGAGTVLTLTGNPKVELASNTTISAKLAGGGVLTKSGSGTLKLTNTANTFSGVINVTAGTLDIPSTGGGSTSIYASQFNLSPGTTLTMPQGALGYWANANPAGVTINVGEGATSGSSYAFGVRYVLTGGTVTCGAGGNRLQLGDGHGFTTGIDSKASSFTSVVGTLGSSDIWMSDSDNGSAQQSTLPIDTELGTTASGIDLDIRANLTGSGGTVSTYPIVKTGAGTLKFSGNVKVSGGITVEGGKLIVAGSSNAPQAANKDIWLKDGTALKVTATGSSSALAVGGSFKVGTNAATPGSAQTIEFVDLSSTTVAPIKGNVVNLDNPVVINISGAIFATGDYPLISTTTSATVNATTPPVLGTLPSGVVATLVNDLAGPTKSLFLHVTTAASHPSLAWDATGSTTGAQDGSGPWSEAAPDTYWWNGTADVPWSNTAGYIATFGSGTVGAYTVTLGGDVSASGLTVNNGTYTIAPGVGTKLTLTGDPQVALAANTTIGAKLGGNGTLTKSGSGTLKLTNAANTFSGVINVTAGTLELPIGANGGQYSSIAASEYNLSPGTTLAMSTGALGWFGNNNAAGVIINANEATTGSCYAYGVSYVLTGSTVNVASGGNRLQLGGSGGFSTYMNSKASSITSVVGTTGASEIWLGGQTDHPFDVELGTTSSGVDLDIRAKITGSGGGAAANTVTKTGAGTLKLASGNTFYAGLNVNAGVVKLTNSTTLADTLKVVMNGGKIDLAPGAEKVKSLYFGATQQADGTWGATGSGAAHIDDTRFSGTGVLLVGDANYTTWSAANAGGQAMGLDYDKDGVPNGIEYFMGATGSTMTTNPGVVNGAVSWPKGATYTGVYGTDYVVQTSTDLVNWTNVASGDSHLSNGSPLTYTLPTGLTRIFVRLKVAGP